MYERLRSAYQEPHRAYHDCVHIDECLRELDAVEDLAHDGPALEAAIWFHDAVYDTHRHDNEERSAGMWREAAMNAGVDPLTVARVEELILATRHTAVPLDLDARLMVDIDLAILGQPTGRFDEYERQVRAEYAWVPPDAFAAARAKILRGFLARPFIYAIPQFQEKYEAKARENLAQSLSRLE